MLDKLEPEEREALVKYNFDRGWKLKNHHYIGKCVYFVLNPQSWNLLYIGITNNPCHRFGSKHKYANKSNDIYIMPLRDETTRDELLELERYYIHLLNPICNIAINSFTGRLNYRRNHRARIRWNEI